MASPSPAPSGRQSLAGQLVVFTGKLNSLGRREARALVVRLGGITADDVTAKTTMLVVGAEGFGATPQAVPPDTESHERHETDPPVVSSVPSADLKAPSRTTRDTTHKLERAEALNAQQGCRIRIISEDDFCRMAGVPTLEALRRQYYATRDLLGLLAESAELRGPLLQRTGICRNLPGC